MTTSASIYYNKIDVNYPTAGRDNDSQGFRDNFTNIKQALASTDSKLTEINLGLVKTSNTVTNFGYNTIKRANLQDCSTNVYDDFSANGVRSQAVAVNYSLGSYQKFVISNGTTNFNIINWPYQAGNTTGLQGSIILSITPESSGITIADFGDYIPVGSTTFPFIFDGINTAFFELWSDDSGATVYINQIGYKDGVVATATSLVATDTIKLGTNTYKTGTDFSTIVYSTATGNIQAAELALLRNIIKTPLDPLSTSGWGSGSTNTFYVTNGVDIVKGASVNFTGSNVTYVVDQVNHVSPSVTSVREIVTTFPIDLTPAPPASIGDDVFFANPTFEDTPIIVTFTTSTVNSTTGSAGDYKGMIYANSSTLYVAHEDYGTTTDNWTKFYDATHVDSIDTVNFARQLAGGTSAQTQTPATNNQYLATTEFVHNIMPYGSIIMWWGNTGSIPTGWALCDGSSGTPDLRNRFIVGADDAGGSTIVTGSPTTTGGTKDAVIVEHNHIANVTDPGHDHTDPTYQYLLKPPYPGSLTGNDYVNAGTEQAVGPGDGGLMATSITGISVSIDNEGESGTNKNLPPYFALCFIMKVI